jgi:hypothetical protein
MVLIDNRKIEYEDDDFIIYSTTKNGSLDFRIRYKSSNKLSPNYYHSLQEAMRRVTKIKEYGHVVNPPGKTQSEYLLKLEELKNNRDEYIKKLELKKQQYINSYDKKIENIKSKLI